MRSRVPRAGVLPTASFAPLLAQTHLRFSSEFPSPGSPEVLHLLVTSPTAFASRLFDDCSSRVMLSARRWRVFAPDEGRLAFTPTLATKRLTLTAARLASKSPGCPSAIKRWIRAPEAKFVI